MNECFVDIEVTDTVSDKPMDIVMIPNGWPYRMASSTHAECVLAEYRARELDEALPERQIEDLPPA